MGGLTVDNPTRDLAIRYALDAILDQVFNNGDNGYSTCCEIEQELHLVKVIHREKHTYGKLMLGNQTVGYIGIGYDVHDPEKVTFHTAEGRRLG
jgi:hypothetical protein